MPTAQLLTLGAIAGLTIYLGLPVAALSRVSTKTKAVLTGVATGILLFLAVEILSKVLEAGESVLHDAVAGNTATGSAILAMGMLLLGVVCGLIGIPLIERSVIGPLGRRRSESGRPSPNSAVGQVPQAGPAGGPSLPRMQAQSAARMEAERSAAPHGAVVAEADRDPAEGVRTAASAGPRPATLSLAIAAGIGLHNFGEGLAIGQSAVSGAASLALLLVIGFALHNMTEGFGVAAPLSGSKPSVGFLAGAGLIAGGPTFVGTLVGASWSSPLATIIFLSLAGGSLVYVTTELLSLGRTSLAKLPLLASMAAGFFAGYLTDLVVSLAGA